MSHFASCREFGTLATSPFDSRNRVERNGLDLSRLTFQVRCWNWGGTQSHSCTTDVWTRGNLKLFQTRIRLSDELPPEIVSVSDEAFGDLT